MFDGFLYQRANSLQRNDATEIMDEFAPRLRKRPDGRDSLLDIGCGSGDVTVDIILPVLPPTYLRVVGADVSEGMLNAARNTYNNPKISFVHIDIDRPLDRDVWNVPFDHVTSFYCLNWVKDQKQALINIKHLLTPEGDCLLVYLASHPCFDLYVRLSEEPRWAPFMKDVAICVPPTQHSSDAAEELRQIFDEVGFSEYEVKVVNKTF